MVMINGRVELPAGERELDWSGSAHRPNARPFGKIGLGVLLSFQVAVNALGIGEASSETDHEATKEMCVDQEVLCMDEASVDWATIRVELPDEPVTLFSEVAFPQPPPPPETTTTTQLPPRKSCEEIVHTVKERVPVPASWQFVCTTRSINIDGWAEPSTNVITLFFGDPEDTNEDWQHTVAHEIAHAWQDELGILNEGYSDRQLEKQADDFAIAFGYYKPNSRGSRAGALATCRLFAQHGVNVCGLT